MNELKEKLNKLRLLDKRPRLFIVEYFDNIRNKIDIECETFLTRHAGSDEERDKAIQQQTEMIKEVDLFEKKCFSNLGSVQFSSIDFDKMQARIESLDMNNKDAVLKAENELESILFQREKTLLMEQEIGFLNNKIIKEKTLTLFGAIFIVMDEYVRFFDESK